jgi:hypothetical protein
MASGEQWWKLYAGEYRNITDSIYPFHNQHFTILHPSTINWPKSLSQGSCKDRLIWGSHNPVQITKVLIIVLEINLNMVISTRGEDPCFQLNLSVKWDILFTCFIRAKNTSEQVHA